MTMGTIDFSETSATKYHLRRVNIPEKRRAPPYRIVSVKTPMNIIKPLVIFVYII